MNSKVRRRLVVVSGIIIIVLVVVLAIVGGSTSAKAVSIADVVEGGLTDQKVQVSGNVVENSFSTEDNVLTFAIYDTEGDPDVQLEVRYEGGVSATFGNEVTAICTGRVDENGVLHASELVTKCPSKYESATEALSVSQLLDYGDKVVGKTVKVTGIVQQDSLTSAGSDVRLVLVDEEDEAVTLAIAFDGALSNTIASGSKLVVQGALDDSSHFVATDVAIAQ